MKCRNGDSPVPVDRTQHAQVGTCTCELHREEVALTLPLAAAAPLVSSAEEGEKALLALRALHKLDLVRDFLECLCHDDIEPQAITIGRNDGGGAGLTSYLGDEEAGESLVLVEREEPLFCGSEDQAAVAPPTVRIRMRDSAFVNNTTNHQLQPHIACASSSSTHRSMAHDVA